LLNGIVSDLRLFENTELTAGMPALNCSAGILAPGFPPDFSNRHAGLEQSERGGGRKGWEKELPVPPVAGSVRPANPNPQSTGRCVK
jgi:hypothetical protein